VQPDDLAFLRKLVDDPLWIEEEGRLDALALYVDYGDWAWVARLTETGESVGLVSLSDDEQGSAETSYATAPGHRNIGLATEMAGRVRDHAFDDLAISELTAWCNVENAPSRRVLEHLGLRAFEPPITRLHPRSTKTQNCWSLIPDHR
jgi:RimJ/RimL family protein N-acetyltransferase